MAHRSNHEFQQSKLARHHVSIVLTLVCRRVPLSAQPRAYGDLSSCGYVHGQTHRAAPAQSIADKTADRVPHPRSGRLTRERSAHRGTCFEPPLVLLVVGGGVATPSSELKTVDSSLSQPSLDRVPVTGSMWQNARCGVCIELRQRMLVACSSIILFVALLDF